MTDENWKAVMATGPTPGTRWRHVKTGGLYVIVDTAIREADGTAMVVYRSETGVVWARPLSEFGDGRYVRASSVRE